MISIPQTRHYTFQQLEQLWVNAGGPRQYAATMAAVALAENNSGDPTAQHVNSNGTIDRGLWQINSSHGYGSTSFDPLQNARQAVTVFKKQGPKAWTTYRSGAFLTHLPGAKTTPSSSALFPGAGRALTNLPGGNVLFGSGPGGIQGGIADAGLGWVKDLEAWAGPAALRMLAYLVLSVAAIALFVLGLERALGPTPFTRAQPYNPRLAPVPY